MKLIIVQMPIGKEQTVPDFAKEVMIWLFILSQGNVGKAFSLSICFWPFVAAFPTILKIKIGFHERPPVGAPEPDAIPISSSVFQHRILDIV